MTVQVNIDNVPRDCRLPAVESAIDDARRLRDQARAAAEQVAVAQRNIDESVQRDVEDAAARARAGEPLGAEGKGVEKARAALLDAQRTLNVTRMAQAGAEDDVAAAITANAEQWTIELAAEGDRAREAARASVDALADALRRLSAAGSATNWLASAIDDQRFDRPARAVIAASRAPSSARRTANGEALGVDEILGYAVELIDPPTSTPTSAPMVENTSALT